MLRLVLLGVVAMLVVMWAKRALAQRDARLEDASVSTAPRTPLSKAEQRLFGRLQSAMPSTMILVRPALAQLLEGRDDGSRRALAQHTVDFAVCGRDSTPIGVVEVDPSDASVEPLVRRAGLRYAAFRSARLPSEREIRDAFGFLA